MLQSQSDESQRAVRAYLQLVAVRACCIRLELAFDEREIVDGLFDAGVFLVSQRKDSPVLLKLLDPDLFAEVTNQCLA